MGLLYVAAPPLIFTTHEKAQMQLYQMTIIATGEVRDAEGNLISTEPIEATTVVTEEQMLAIQQGTQE